MNTHTYCGKVAMVRLSYIGLCVTTGWCNKHKLIQDACSPAFKDTCCGHEKTDLKILVVVIPKEGWARVAAPSLLLVWHRLFRIWLCWHHRLYSRKVSVMPNEGWARPCAPIAHPSFGMTTTKTLRSVFSWRASPVYQYSLRIAPHISYLMTSHSVIKSQMTDTVNFSC